MDGNDHAYYEGEIRRLTEQLAESQAEAEKLECECELLNEASNQFAKQSNKEVYQLRFDNKILKQIIDELKPTSVTALEQVKADNHRLRTALELAIPMLNFIGCPSSHDGTEQCQWCFELDIINSLDAAQGGEGDTK